MQRSFVTFLIEEDKATDRSVVEGAIAIPGLPVCHVRMRVDHDRLGHYGPAREALFSYLLAALREDVTQELPFN
jgi:hypothetical protein